MFDLATHLPKDVYPEVAVVFGTPGLLATRLQEQGIGTFCINAMQRDVSIASDLQVFGNYYTVVQAGGKPDIVHLNSSKAAGLGALAARLAGVKKLSLRRIAGLLEQRNVVVTSVYIHCFVDHNLLAHHTIVVSSYDLRIAKRMPFVKNKVQKIYNAAL